MNGQFVEMQIQWLRNTENVQVHPKRGKCKLRWAIILHLPDFLKFKRSEALLAGRVVGEGSLSWSEWEML